MVPQLRDFVTAPPELTGDMGSLSRRCVSAQDLGGSAAVSHSSNGAKPLDWEALLVDGYESIKISQRVFRRLPSEPRCKLCLNPFGGLAGNVIGVLGRKPSRKNPNICQFCFDH